MVIMPSWLFHLAISVLSVWYACGYSFGYRVLPALLVSSNHFFAEFNNPSYWLDADHSGLVNLIDACKLNYIDVYALFVI